MFFYDVFLSPMNPRSAKGGLRCSLENDLPRTQCNPSQGRGEWGASVVPAGRPLCEASNAPRLAGHVYDKSFEDYHSALKYRRRFEISNSPPPPFSPNPPLFRLTELQPLILTWRPGDKGEPKAQTDCHLKLLNLFFWNKKKNTFCFLW